MKTPETFNSDEIRFQIGVLMRDGYHCAANMLKKLAADAVKTFHEYEQLKAMNQDSGEHAELFMKENAELLQKIKQLERERDAAIHDLNMSCSCAVCIKGMDKDYISNDCVDCDGDVNFVWRGLCKENGGIE